MKINKKRDLILKSIIEAYLSDSEPIGSNELMLRMDDMIPASTIRVYFKKLSNEGAIKQLHISSGRIPTILAMVDYWKKVLNFDEPLVINDAEIFERICSKFEIYCMIFNSEDEFLNEVINHNDRFLILVFDNTHFIMKFDIRVYEFLNNLIGSSIKELEQISMQIGLSELRQNISNYKKSKIKFVANEVVTFEIFKDERFKLLLNPDFSNTFSKDILFSPFFEDGFMGIKRDVLFENSHSTMICAGSVYENFGKFFDLIMEVA
ncbi:MAG: HrcA family transcriptional regulator [Campylobacter sp.]|nr:HrcA family transcriptional regulator [Campylobacter sp.]